MSKDLVELFRTVELARAAWERLRPELDRRLADRFNPLDFLRTNELGLSDILRWMLDAGESHGQGDLFLRLLLNELKVLEGTDTYGARARCEVATHRIAKGQRRLDVLVEFGGCELAIENKPDAGWQDAQVADYLAHLDSGGGRACLLVLRGDGDHLPDEQLAHQERKRRTEAGTLVDTTWAAMLPWLRHCAHEAEAERVRHFIKELARHVGARFNNAGDVAMTRTLAEELAASPNMLAAAADVLAARDPILEEIGRRFERAVRTRWEGISVQHRVSTEQPDRLLTHMKKWTGLDLEFASVRDVCFRLQFDGKGYSEPCWGLHPLNDDVPKARKRLLVSRSTTALPYRIEANEEDGWIWWQWLEKARSGLRSDHAADIWRAMADPREELAKAVVRQAEAVERLVTGAAGAL